MDAIDFHYHGIDGLDLQKEPELVLSEVEEELTRENTRAILIFNLPQEMFNNFLKFMKVYHEGLQLGRYIYIVGIAIEGPLLTNLGGTPQQGIWPPTESQWRQIASCGTLGLKYVVISSDINLQVNDSGSFLEDKYPSDISWIANTLLDGNVLPALGHFSKSNPIECARTIENFLTLVDKHGGGPIITDHLFNDMPLNFKHAWRTPGERLHRERDLITIDLPSWNWENIGQKMGPVPATLLHGAKAGLLKLCLNFDGEHVDLAISKKTVEIIGADNIMIMSDRIPKEIAGGQKLSRIKGSTLLFQAQGVVAGGSKSISQQIKHMQSAGITDIEIEKIVSIVPSRILHIPLSLDAHKTQIFDSRRV